MVFNLLRVASILLETCFANGGRKFNAKAAVLALRQLELNRFRESHGHG
jgi:hypothetical protein